MSGGICFPKWKIAPRQDDDLFSHLLALRNFSAEDLWGNFSSERLDAIYALLPQLDRAVALIKQAISQRRPIVVHGDYDADGVCATAILWSALYHKKGYKQVYPFIPNRFDHGYGLSEKSLASIARHHPGALVISVDCGITACRQVSQGKEAGLEFVISDHHQKENRLPPAIILWTDQLSGAGIAWVLARKLGQFFSPFSPSGGLDLVAIATIADVQPLSGHNRFLVKAGLGELQRPRRLGLAELYRLSGLAGKEIGAYEVGWIIAPRLNASGRLADAKQALRLLVTQNLPQAREIAQQLDAVNRERQELTKQQYQLARELLAESPSSNILWARSPKFHEGVIGLIAGRLAQEFNRPAVVVAEKGRLLKGSARSVPGVNIIKLLRRLEKETLSLGGHSGAGGFSLLAEKGEEFSRQLALLGKQLDKSLFARELFLDALVSPQEVTEDLWDFLRQLSPFGEGNPSPCFVLPDLVLEEFTLLGRHSEHLKMRLAGAGRQFTALWFSFPTEILPRLTRGRLLTVAFSLRENIFRSLRELQLVVKDVVY